MSILDDILALPESQRARTMAALSPFDLRTLADALLGRVLRERQGKGRDELLELAGRLPGGDALDMVASQIWRHRDYDESILMDAMNSRSLFNALQGVIGGVDPYLAAVGEERARAAHAVAWGEGERAAARFEGMSEAELLEEFRQHAGKATGEAAIPQIVARVAFTATTLPVLLRHPSGGVEIGARIRRAPAEGDAVAAAVLDTVGSPPWGREVWPATMEVLGSWIEATAPGADHPLLLRCLAAREVRGVDRAMLHLLVRHPSPDAALGQVMGEAAEGLLAGEGRSRGGRHLSGAAVGVIGHTLEQAAVPDEVAGRVIARLPHDLRIHTELLLAISGRVRRSGGPPEAVALLTEAKARLLGQGPVRLQVALLPVATPSEVAGIINQVVQAGSVHDLATGELGVAIRALSAEQRSGVPMATWARLLAQRWVEPADRAAILATVRPGAATPEAAGDEGRRSGVRR